MPHNTKRILLDNMYAKLEEAMLSIGVSDTVIKGGGTVSCKIALIGEAPGAAEEKQGCPFVGAAGKNLDMFLKTLEIKREDIYITNVVKWRPKRISEKSGRTVNRPPSKKEVELCAPFLFEELKIVNPKIVVTLGNVALKAAAGNDMRIGDYHGRLLSLSGLLIFPLYHPASVIYNRALYDVYDSDLVLLRAALEPVY